MNVKIYGIDEKYVFGYPSAIKVEVKDAIGENPKIVITELLGNKINYLNYDAKKYILLSAEM